jgi:copper chaperone CopZ
MEIKLKVNGMTCGHCSAKVEQVLSEEPGVESAKVDLSAGTALITSTDEVLPQTLIQKVIDAGFEASIFSETEIKKGFWGKLKQLFSSAPKSAGT